VLPPPQLRALHHFLGWIRQRDRLEHDWGARRYGGPTALFWGASGTGKTFAAAVLANELSWPLYRVDLAAVLSKYIGETERNLNQLFAAAHDQPLVLQFDEADGLFGRRGEITDGRDRYANLEVSHLLARVEVHRGPCILTTNLKSNLDAAFLRRFQTVVSFPRPDAAARNLLWEHLLPPRAPREQALDVSLLGSAIALTGGAIHNAALYAAVLAAEDNRPIGLDHIAIAVWREASKDGPSISPASLGALAEHVPAWLREREGAT
jgi:SpoVK/Ycf46/Vps4 family AAA+-type ATPase